MTALKSALDDGLQAILFEQSANIGGQWYQQNDYSGVWESLHTNTSRQVTVFSDLPHQLTRQGLDYILPIEKSCNIWRIIKTIFTWLNTSALIPVSGISTG